MSEPVELVLIGAGRRGTGAYAPYALEHPEQMRFVAVAEPNPARRERFAREHSIPADRQFEGWEDLLSRPQLADAALVCTQDQLHVASGVAALEAGYHVLIEKPLAPTLDACIELIQTAERTGRILEVCHVLRYTAFFRRLHEVLESGCLGDIVTVEHRENVATWHMAHSYVRGNWANQNRSSSMLLSKCCHDLDILAWNMDRPCVRLSSVGSLMHYRADQVSAEIPARCTNGCPIEPVCAFSAIGIYLEGRPFPNHAVTTSPNERTAFRRNSFATAITDDLSNDGILHALRTGPYGRCVYRCDNDVVDHQVVTMEFEGGASVVLVMHGHSNEEHRSMRYDGTRATLRGRFGSPMSLQIHDHLTGEVKDVTPETGDGGHGGGDFGLMSSFTNVLRGEEMPRTGAREALESHLLVFAAENARLHHEVVELDQYRRRASGSNHARALN